MSLYFGLVTLFLVHIMALVTSFYLTQCSISVYFFFLLFFFLPLKSCLVQRISVLCFVHPFLLVVAIFSPCRPSFACVPARTCAEFFYLYDVIAPACVLFVQESSCAAPLIHLRTLYCRNVLSVGPFMSKSSYQFA